MLLNGYNMMLQKQNIPATRFLYITEKKKKITTAFLRHRIVRVLNSPLSP